MVDVSSQNKNINVTASSIGTAGNINVTSDMVRYWSEKSKQWAISDRLIDDEDYSSKYYANQSKQNAQKVEDTVQEVINTANSALSDIGSAKDSAISDITSQENISVENVNTAGATQVSLAKEQADIATEQAQSVSNKVQEVEEATENALTSITNQETISKNSLIDEGSTQIGLIQQEGQTQISNIEQTGFYMRDGHLYYIDENGEEQEFVSGGGSSNLGVEYDEENETLVFTGESFIDTVSTALDTINGEVV